MNLQNSTHRLPHPLLGLAGLLGCQLILLAAAGSPASPLAESSDLYLFNRAPLAAKPYTELPLGNIEPRGWLRDELERMATGMTGNLDLWYPEVAGPRNAWLGGDGDTWERGPYWIDGLYPLARLLQDDTLLAKAQRWIDYTLEHQRDDGTIGPVLLPDAERTQPPPRGAQIERPDDWWPRMVMLKILQQHYLATGDPRVVDLMTRYFRYQLDTLPSAPLMAPEGGPGGSWWARQRGGDNLLSVLWLYNLTGEAWLLKLADLIHEQTIPVTDWFLAGDVVKLRGDQYLPGLNAFHCVNLAQAMKTPLIRFQQDPTPRHLEATRKAFDDIRAFHGQPHGLYGGDEGLHGRGLERGSELCSAVEMMFSLEKMLEITGETEFADRLEQIAFNPLPTQVTDDHHARQYFQQANQVQLTMAERGFFDHGVDGQVYGLLQGYPCCTCNLHQGWPKFVQHLWMASVDRGLAALAYGPCHVTARVGQGTEVSILEETGYPFSDRIRFTVQPTEPVAFPLRLRIPGWCDQASLSINGQVQPSARAGTVVQLLRTWEAGDQVSLHLPMRIRRSNWEERSVSVERGPLVYALRVEEAWSKTPVPAPEGVPTDGPDRGYRECRPASPWNYALLESALRNPEQGFEVVQRESVAVNPWNLENAPVELRTQGVRLPEWTLYANSAGRVPLSPVSLPGEAEIETIRLIPYGCTTLRITAFPWVRSRR